MGFIRHWDSKTQTVSYSWIVKCGICSEQVIIFVSPGFSRGALVLSQGHLCCLRGADVFLNPFFKWPCCTVCPDRWTEDKARLAAWPFFKSSVCSPYAARRGSCYMMCSSLHSFLVERWHWTVEDGERSLGAKYWGLHTPQHRPIYSIKMWYLILLCSWLYLFGRNTNIAVSSAMLSELNHLSLSQILLWNNLWYKAHTSLEVSLSVFDKRALLLTCLTHKSSFTG